MQILFTVQPQENSCNGKRKSSAIKPATSNFTNRALQILQNLYAFREKKTKPLSHLLANGGNVMRVFRKEGMALVWEEEARDPAPKQCEVCNVVRSREFLCAGESILRCRNHFLRDGAI